MVVAGRPDPPVPMDVPRWHPLRDQRIVRRLAVSPQAQIIRDDAELELRHLLDRSGLQHQLLGLVTAAGGGLSQRDLAELTELPSSAVEGILRGLGPHVRQP